MADFDLLLSDGLIVYPGRGSVPGSVGTQAFGYLQIALGYLVGYALIAAVLLPLYYRLRVTSIYDVLGQRLGDAWGQQFVVDNRPGAGGNVARLLPPLRRPHDPGRLSRRLLLCRLSRHASRHDRADHRPAADPQIGRAHV